MQSLKKTEAPATQEVAASQNQTTILVETYGKPITNVKTAFALPKESQLSKKQIMHTHYWLKSAYVPNFRKMVEVLEHLLRHAPYAHQKEGDLRRILPLLRAMQLIEKAAYNNDFFEQSIYPYEEIKEIHLSNIDRKINTGSLLAMDALLNIRNAHHQTHFPKRNRLASLFVASLLHLYVKDFDLDMEFCVDAILNLLIEYDQ